MSKPQQDAADNLVQIMLNNTPPQPPIKCYVPVRHTCSHCRTPKGPNTYNTCVLCKYCDGTGRITTFEPVYH